jgi:hypothetical protein
MHKAILEKQIAIILTRPQKHNLTFDILDTEKRKLNQQIALTETQRRMKNGEIWQEVLGSYDGFTNLKTGHETGLDAHFNKCSCSFANRIHFISYIYS